MACVHRELVYKLCVISGSLSLHLPPPLLGPHLRASGSRPGCQSLRLLWLRPFPWVPCDWGLSYLHLSLRSSWPGRLVPGLPQAPSSVAAAVRAQVGRAEACLSGQSHPESSWYAPACSPRQPCPGCTVLQGCRGLLLFWGADI